MPRFAAKLAWSSLIAASVVCLPFANLPRPSAAGQNSHAGPVTGVIDGVAFEGGRYYVHGWACQEGQRPSIDVHIYAGGAAGQGGTFVTAGTANFGNEPFVIRRGDRIAQIVVAPVARASFDLVDELPPTERGGSGFGSTGVSA